MKKLPLEKSSGWRKDNAEHLPYKIKEYNGQTLLINALGEPHFVSSQGSLALLALGAQGLKAWKKAKALNRKS